MNALKIVTFLVKILFLFFVFKCLKEEPTDNKFTIIYTIIVTFWVINNFKKECKK